MKEEVKALADYRLGQAKESLEEAEILPREEVSWSDQQALLCLLLCRPRPAGNEGSEQLKA
jgi:hypothetical protein